MKKIHVINIVLLFAFFGTLFHMFYYNNNDKYDVYFLDDHYRYLQNIVRDNALLLSSICNTFLIYFISKNGIKIKKLSKTGFLIRSLFVYTIFSFVFYYVQYKSSLIYEITLTFIIMLYLYKQNIINELNRWNQ